MLTFVPFAIFQHPERHALLTISAAAIGVHVIFKRYEPKEPLVHMALLVGSPAFLSFLLAPHNISATFLIFFASLAASIVLYRLSPLHPLARYPGPLLHKISALDFTRIALRGRPYAYIKRLHEKYGDIIRIGPNEVSIRDASAIPGMLGSTGFPKSKAYLARAMWPPVSPLIATSGEEHAARRKWWNRGFSSGALKDYEKTVAHYVSQLGGSLAEQEERVDLGTLFSYLTFDIVNDIAFGKGPNMLANGDTGGLWSLLQGTQCAARVFSNMPWVAMYARMLLALGMSCNFKLFRAYGIQRAKERVEQGSLYKDLFYYLNNEDGAEKQGRPLPHVINDGVLAILAGSDTTANVLTNLFYFLLSNPVEYQRLQAEIDKYYPRGESAFDVKHHQSMPILNAAINEALRLVPVLPGGSQRDAPSGGKVVGPYYLPGGTTAAIHNYSVNHDPRNFAPYTSSFWPDRWLIASGDKAPVDAGIDEGAFVHNAYAFIPFSFGPANCVGKNLAMQEMRMTVCHLMQRFDIGFAPGFDSASYEKNLREYFVMHRAELLVQVIARDKGIM
ncbi:high nitrogen upregulated cytochrome P450 monooxygenase 2 [Obba rivulosa]|uniref:High nitrogen upregulated cytochrome P450 monooxygenase 2 n=1 Tax=Obba rivulosa TaxID=1052685 RepID=A0A8E2AVM8_9APHY|nr:high nitrogen upregulated cytochrome P450 monooxygenase 2 [Obba rivulosa]